jgi:hypothetical protein
VFIPLFTLGQPSRHGGGGQGHDGRRQGT